MLDRPDLVQRGFRGFVPFDELLAGRLAEIPTAPGTYVILWKHSQPPTFVAESCGGHFKAKNPKVEVDTLVRHWVPGASVIYIGKAERLQRRIKQYAQFGTGRPIGHWGGRYIWQIEDCHRLPVAWRALPEGGDARGEETKSIGEFVAAHGTRPFANLTA
ncbi:MAG: hypothetical protein ACRDLB_13155 [Actinomycetota bacterium]